MEEFKYLRVLFMNDGKLNRERDIQIGSSSAVMRVMHWSIEVKGS